jgi:hypothetical protein
MNIPKSRQPSLPSFYYIRALLQLIAITPEVREASQLTGRKLFPGRKPEPRSCDFSGVAGYAYPVRRKLVIEGLINSPGIIMWYRHISVIDSFELLAYSCWVSDKITVQSKP